ncbi:MAG: hypothetical protein KJP02_09705 [Octadecabacter sp.]|nr:hypothetical protein [Octadecabacter sp.]
MLTPLPPSLPLAKRAFYSIPVVGWLARDVMYGDHDNIYYLLVIIATAVIISFSIWGLPALVIKALIAVPFYMLFLIVVASPWTPNE